MVNLKYTLPIKVIRLHWKVLGLFILQFCYIFGKCKFILKYFNLFLHFLDLITNLFKMSSEDTSNNDPDNKSTPSRPIPGGRQEM